MRLKRFKADPDKYRAIRLAKANGDKSEDYLGQPSVDISGQSEESSELSLATESDSKRTRTNRTRTKTNRSSTAKNVVARLSDVTRLTRETTVATIV